MSDSARISKATRYNWKKLNSDSQGKLTKRANKTRSTKRIVAAGYLDNPHALDLFQKVSVLNAPVDQVMAALVRSALNHKGLLQKPHVQAFLQDYAHLQGPEIEVPAGIWDSDDDVLGFLLPTSLLKTRAGADFRKFILQHTTIKQIDFNSCLFAHSS